MLVVVAGPSGERRQRALQIIPQELSDRELRGSEAGEVFQRIQRDAALGPAIQGDVVREEQGDKARRQTWRQLAEDAEVATEIPGQHGMQAFRHAAQALH